MKKFALYFSFCVMAVAMILLRPVCAGAVNYSITHSRRCSFNAIQRVIKKNDSHENAIEITEIRQSAKMKVVLPPVSHPYDHILINDITIEASSSHTDPLSALSTYDIYFQITSRLRV
jgi:hypothetical protein